MDWWHYAVIGGAGLIVLVIMALRHRDRPSSEGSDTGTETYIDARHVTHITRGDDIASI